MNCVKFVLPDIPSVIVSFESPASGISALVSPIVFAKSGVIAEIKVKRPATYAFFMVSPLIA